MNPMVHFTYTCPRSDCIALGLERWAIMQVILTACCHVSNTCYFSFLTEPTKMQISDSKPTLTISKAILILNKGTPTDAEENEMTSNV